MKICKKLPKVMDSDLLSPFEINEVEPYDYTFVSKFGIKYRVFFSPMEELYPQLINTYSFSIERESNSPHPMDARIAVTIVAILRRFFENNENAMIMICDTLDGKEAKRRKLFDRWYKLYNDGTLDKLDASASTADYELFISIYFTRNNPHRKDLIQAFRDLLAKDLYEMAI